MADYIEIPLDEGLAQAIKNNALGRNLWVVVKYEGEPSLFRAVVSSWTAHGDGKLGVDFESWQSYAERKLQALGL